MGTKTAYKPDTVRLAFAEYFVGPESDDGEQRAFCPLCEDPGDSASPSASFNIDKMMWNCLKGGHGGGIPSLIKAMKDQKGWDIRSAAMKARNADPEYKAKRDAGLEKAGKKAAPLPDAAKVKGWHDSLLGAKEPLRTLIQERGFTMDTLSDWMIGWDGNRYTIPVTDVDGNIVNVRRYKLKATSQNDKMLNIPGHGQARIFRPDILQDNDLVVLTEGETDCIILNQYGIPAVTHTAGAMTFRPQWGALFAGKQVYVCYDNDDTGNTGANKAAKIISKHAESVKIVEIPLPNKGADITDFLVKEGHTMDDFIGLMAEARPFSSKIKASKDIPMEGKPVTMLESMSQEIGSEVVQFEVSVSGKQQSPYYVPRSVKITCDMSKGPACTNCPIFATAGDTTLDFQPNDEELFRFVEASEDRMRKLIREISGARCSDHSEFEIVDKYVVEELLIQPSVDSREESEEAQPVKRTAFSIGTHKTAVNRKVELVGRNVTDPKNGKQQFMAWRNEQVEADLDRFELTDEVFDRLRKFKANMAGGQMPLDKCIEIAADMAENVTHIYGRELLHVAYDLVWHSVTTFRIHDTVVDKGWLEMLVVGDTRTGKSETAKMLSRHYKSGVVVSCEGMSFAGIVGGVQQINDRWHMTWGIVPMNDRRLVVLDEMSGLKDKDVIEQMSSIRSSGIAQITKINSDSTNARTRLIWITNPADGTMLGDNPGVGMAALRTVVKNSEDIARFDFVAAASVTEVKSSVINSSFEDRHQPEYSSEDSELLVKWAWSLGRDDVQFTPKAIEEVVKAAQEISSRYVTDPPLIQAENVRFKLLRIAVALAARTFNVRRDTKKLVVETAHVMDAVRFLDMIYSSESMGYARKSRRDLQNTAMGRMRKQNCVQYLRLHEDTVLQTLRMVGGRTFRVRDFKEFASMSDDDAQTAVKKLLEWRMIHLKSRGDIAMSPVLISIMRELEDEDDL